MIVEMLVYLPPSHLAQLLAQESLTEFSRCESFQLYT